MKTNYLLITIALLTGMTSCATRYRMVSRIDKDGTMYREVYAKADSAFMAGDGSHYRIAAREDKEHSLSGTQEHTK